MPFDPSGQPTLPTCESDLARWAEQFAQWIITKLTATHSEIDDIVIDPVDVCTLVQDLGGTDCLVPPGGIDLSGLSYANIGDTLPLPPGVLPYPNTIGVRSGTVDITGITHSQTKTVTVTISPEFPDGDYSVVLSQATRDHYGFFVNPATKQGGQFTLSIYPFDGCRDGECTATLYWIAHYLGD